MPDPLRERWSAAFQRQARSDERVYELLSRSSLSPCHRLHYLQMFLEKLCKAHLWIEHDLAQGPPDFLHSHKVIAKALPLIVREHLRRNQATEVSHHRMREFREICVEIDLLSPAVDAAGDRPDNCEYPWSAVQARRPVVHAPCEWDFRIDNRLRSPAGKELLKAVCALVEVE